MSGTAGHISAGGAPPLPPVWEQAMATSTYSLSAAIGTWEQVATVPTITIAEAGVYDVDYSARAAVIVLAASTGVLTVGLYKNGALIPGTEACLVNAQNDANTQAQNIQANVGMPFVHRFAAGDTVELWAKATGTPSQAVVASDANGRTRVDMHRIAP